MNEGVQVTSAATHLQEPVEWNPRQQDVGKELGQRENAVDHPVRQPLRVVLFVHRFNRLHATRQATADQQQRVAPLARATTLKSRR